METLLSTSRLLTVGLTILVVAAGSAAWIFWHRKRFEKFLKDYLENLYVRHTKKPGILLHPKISEVESEHFLDFFCVTVHFKILEVATANSPDSKYSEVNSPSGREFVYTFNNTRSILDSVSDFEMYVADNHRTRDEVLAENQAWWDRVTQA